MSDDLTVFGTDYVDVTGIKARGAGNGLLTFLRPKGTKSISANGTGIDVAAYANVDVAVPTSVPSLQSKTKSYAPTETAQSETVSADSGYDGLSSVDISVGAISSTYIGSGIVQRGTGDITTSGATVMVPSGYYAQAHQKAVAPGTEGTPTASKGSVSNHSVSVTPSVTNSAGYITGSTKTGTAVTVSASELVSGTKAISESGTTDVTNYASVSVDAGGIAVAASKGTVLGHSITVSPYADTTMGFIGSGRTSGTAVTVSASELVSGTKSIDANGTGIDVTEYASVDVSVPAPTPSLQTVTKSYTPTETAQTDTVTPGAGYDGIGEVDISVGAISSTYVGSGITQRSSTDLTASEDTVSVPAGYYVEAASKAVSSGTVNTPTATKGTVSNHSVSVTPSVNVYPGGYIGSGVRNGTAVTVSASELVSGTYTVDSSGTKDVTNYASVSVPAGSATIDLTIDDFAPSTITVSNSGLITATNNGGSLVTPDVVPGYVSEGTEGEINISGSATKQLFTQAAKTVTPTESEQTAVSTGCYTTGTVKVGAISSTYVGSGISQRSSTDLTASGATVSVPSGYYSEQASKSVDAMTLPSTASSSSTGTQKAEIPRHAGTRYINIPTGYNSTAQYYMLVGTPDGTAGTPTATKGTVSNNAVSVTPSVTNTTGYITGGAKTGTAVTVSASELVSGTKSITASGTTDVTNYASASVASGGATASATKGSVSNHSVTVTPSVTRTAGYITTGSANGTAVTVSASELVSGSETKTANGTYDVTNLASLVVALDFSTIYTSSSNPSSSQGANGDIWLVTS